MESQEFLRRSAALCGLAHNYSLGQMIEHRSHQSLLSAVTKSLYAKTIHYLIANELCIEGRRHDMYAAGGQQIVYASESGVVKVITRSLSRDRQTAEGEAGLYQQGYDKASLYLGEQITKTEFDIRRLRGGIYAAIALQPRVRAVHEFIDVNDMVMFRDDEPYMNELQKLLDALTELYRQTGLQMDLNGPRNVSLVEETDGPHIEIVDTIVVSPEMQQVFDGRRGLSTGETILEKMNLLRACVAIRPI